MFGGVGYLPRMNIFIIAQYAMNLMAVLTAEVKKPTVLSKERVQLAAHLIMTILSTIGVTGLTLVTEKHTT